jgi:hypothetical protein
MDKEKMLAPITAKEEELVDKLTERVKRVFIRD